MVWPFCAWIVCVNWFQIPVTTFSLEVCKTDVLSSQWWYMSCCLPSFTDTRKPIEATNASNLYWKKTLKTIYQYTKWLDTGCLSELWRVFQQARHGSWTDNSLHFSAVANSTNYDVQSNRCWRSFCRTDSQVISINSCTGRLEYSKKTGAGNFASEVRFLITMDDCHLFKPKWWRLMNSLSCLARLTI